MSGRALRDREGRTLRGDTVFRLGEPRTRRDDGLDADDWFFSHIAVTRLSRPHGGKYGHVPASPRHATHSGRPHQYRYPPCRPPRLLRILESEDSQHQIGSPPRASSSTMLRRRPPDPSRALEHPDRSHPAASRGHRQLRVSTPTIRLRRSRRRFTRAALPPGVSSDPSSSTRASESRRGSTRTSTISPSSSSGTTSLGDHREATHGLFIYDATVRVPLLMKVPGVHPGRAIAQVRAIDIMPTVLALPGVTPSSALDGVSLRPILEDRKSDPGLQAYVESQYARLHFGRAPSRHPAPSATSSSMHRSPSCTIRRTIRPKRRISPREVRT